MRPPWSPTTHPCGVPRGMNTNPPGPAMNCSSSIVDREAILALEHPIELLILIVHMEPNACIRRSGGLDDAERPIGGIADEHHGVLRVLEDRPAPNRQAPSRDGRSRDDQQRRLELPIPADWQRCLQELLGDTAATRRRSDHPGQLDRRPEGIQAQEPDQRLSFPPQQTFDPDAGPTAQHAPFQLEATPVGIDNTALQIAHSTQSEGR